MIAPAPNALRHERCAPHRGAARPPRGAHWCALALACLLALLALAGCSPTEGEDGVFDPEETTNDDFLAPAFHTVGNLPITMDLTVNAGMLDLVAVVNNIADPPVNPDGTFNESGTISILGANTDGTFTDLDQITTREFPTLALWADLNAPAGDLDLVVLDDQNFRVAIYLSNVVGSWPNQPSQTFQFDGPVVQLVIADVDGTNGADIVLVPSDEDVITTLLNDGAGTFTRHDTDSITAISRIAVGQFNAGANLDLAALRPAALQIDLYQWSPANNQFRQQLPTELLTPPNRPIRLVTGLLDGDGDVDIAVLSDTGDEDTNLVTVYRNNGNGNFSEEDTVVVSNRGRQLFVVDAVTAQSGLDLVVVHTNQRIVSLLEANNANYSVTRLDTTRNPIDVISAEVTGNTSPDLISAESDRRTLGIFSGNGSGDFTRTQIGFLSKVTFPRAVSFDGTGASDIIALQPNSDRLVILRNKN